MPEVRPAVLRRDAERLALAGGDVGAVRAGRREDGEETGSTTATNSAPAAWASRPISAIGSSRPRKSGWAAMTPGDRRSASASSRSSAARSVVPAAASVGDERDLVELEPAAEVGPQRRPVVRDGPPRETRTRSRRVARQVISAASAVAAAPS